MSTPDTDLRTWPHRLGIRPGDTVVLMADLTRMAWRARRTGGSFSADELLDAFLQAVTPGGAVFVPTFTHHLIHGGPFNVRRTPSISGALANAALAHPAFKRTEHPLHSFAVAGAGAEDWAARPQEGSFDEGSPFAHFVRVNAHLIAIDLPADDAFTFVHRAEEEARVPYRRYRHPRFQHIDARGVRSDRRFGILAKRPGHVNAFDGLVPLLEAAGALHAHELNGSRAMVVDLRAAHTVVLQNIRTDQGRAIHHFSYERWAKDTLKALLRTFGFRQGR